MKTNHIRFALSLLALAGLVSCGGTTSSSVAPASSASSTQEKATSENKTSTKASSAEESDDDDTDDDEDTEVEYSANVKYDNGDPFANCMIQWCTESYCLQPKTADENGYASFIDKKNTNTYYVHCASAHPGYAVDPYGYVSDKTTPHVDIVLYPFSSYVDDSITSLGFYEVTLTSEDVANGGKEISISLDAGSYHIESWHDASAAAETPDLNPDIKLFSGESELASDTDSGNADNFALNFDLESASTITAKISGTTAGTFPIFLKAQLDVLID